MATVHVAFARAMDGHAPVIASRPASSQAITSSAVSQATTIAAGNNETCVVTSVGGAVWVQVAGTPVAAAGTDWLIPDGATREFGHVPPGSKVAVINA